jgi:CheY-like chemotaxis protein
MSQMIDLDVLPVPLAHYAQDGQCVRANSRLKEWLNTTESVHRILVQALGEDGKLQFETWLGRSYELSLTLQLQLSGSPKWVQLTKQQILDSGNGFVVAFQEITIEKWALLALGTWSQQQRQDRGTPLHDFIRLFQDWERRSAWTPTAQRAWECDRSKVWNDALRHGTVEFFARDRVNLESTLFAITDEIASLFPNYLNVICEPHQEASICSHTDSIAFQSLLREVLFELAEATGEGTLRVWEENARKRIYHMESRSPRWAENPNLAEKILTRINLLEELAVQCGWEEVDVESSAGGLRVRWRLRHEREVWMGTWPRILIVEDEEVQAKSMMKMLRKQGYRVVWAKSGREAILRAVDYPDIYWIWV